jgi:NAD(P)-dependent dehydrogenase (short-subunit alcohol dehydrogenase family)
MDRKIAFVTGASRGIGKACAVELADAGFDVAITARTVNETEARPGSLASTAAAIEAKGAKAFAVAADLLDPASLGVAVTRVLDAFGRIDVIVQNGRYVGPGHRDLFLETPMELLRKQMEANLFAVLIINQLALPAMIAAGGGTIVNITSAAGYVDPVRPAGAGGGYGMGYALSKGAFQRIAGFLKVELADRGIRCFGVQPGYTITEERALAGIKTAPGGGPSAPMEVTAKVVRWLCTSPEAASLNGQHLEAQDFCRERGLLPGWA